MIDSQFSVSLLCEAAGFVFSQVHVTRIEATYVLVS